MTMLCAHDDDGKILGWYPPERAGEISGNYVEVSDAIWHDATQAYASHIDLSDMTFSRIGPAVSVTKAQLKSAIDAAAEAERLKYITGGAGQAMTYSQKADEAHRYLAATDPDPADYPLLSAEVGITAQDLGGVATIVNAAFRQWQVIGAAIEAVRLGTKAAIDAATTIEEAQTAYASAAWPEPET